MRSTLTNIPLWRALVGDKLDEGEDLGANITYINLTDDRGLFIWTLHNNSQFAIHFMYLHIINQNMGSS